jgi:predicted transcriptional regulator
MYTDYISKKIKGVSPRTKYFLLLWLKSFQEIEVILSHDELRSKFLISSKLISKALKELQAIGLIQRERNAKRKGEPTYRYRANASTAMSKIKRRLSLLQPQSLTSEAGKKKQVINDILEHPIAGLDTPQQLLFLTLWYLANDSGVIDSVGIGNLAKIVGCSKDSIRRYLKDLERNNLLDKICTGFTAEAFFGVRDSVYVLTPPSYSSFLILEIPNIKEKNFSILSSISGAILSSQKEDDIDNDFQKKIATDFSCNVVQNHFLYWFWRYVYLTVCEPLNREASPINAYRLKVLYQIPESNVSRIAESLFSPNAFDAKEKPTKWQYELIEFIHKLAVTTALDTFPSYFNDIQEEYSTKGLIYLLPGLGVYQKQEW